MAVTIRDTRSATGSDDIHEIFRAAAAHIGLQYTVRPFVTCIARRLDVAVMDDLVGEKR
jgi:hypothetical protein